MRAIYRFLKYLWKKYDSYEPVIVVNIDKKRLLANYKYFARSCRGLQIAPVLKSNAYGHGLVTVAKVLQNEEIPFFVIDSLYEAVILRREGISVPILIVGYTPTGNIVSCGLRDITFVVSSLEQLKELHVSCTRAVTIHLKFDTGMCRQGLLFDEAESAITILKSETQIHISGLCSHFSQADGEDMSFTKEQINRWISVKRKFEQSSLKIEFHHVSATSGLKYLDMLETDMIRLGRGLYGFDPGGEHGEEIACALSVTTQVGSIKKIHKGQQVGYGGTFTAPDDMVIATIPCGYAEGVDLRLAERAGVVKIHNFECPIVGKVSMNITTVDVSAVENISLGDKVVLLSQERGDGNSVKAISERLGIGTSEVLVRIPSYLRRNIV